jgi:hypothetical protein
LKAPELRLKLPIVNQKGEPKHKVVPDVDPGEGHGPTVDVFGAAASERLLTPPGSGSAAKDPVLDEPVAPCFQPGRSRDA